MDTATSKLEPVAAAAVRVCSKGYNPLDHHLAALGTEVLKCKKSLGPDDFVIQKHPRDPNGKIALVRNFECDEKSNQAIDNLLGLQLVEYSRSNPYFMIQWNEFLERYKRAGSPECPLWEHLDARTETPPTPENVRKYLGVQGEVKTHNFWQLHPASSTSNCQEASCLVRSARICTSWLGVRFWEGGEELAQGIVKTDPNWWKDNTNYGHPDFFDTLGWQHRMATDSGWVPGDIYGAPARWGEMCTYWAPDMLTVMTNGFLYPVECAPGWFCATQCKWEGALPLPAPVPAF
jgi:hypothetical protein